MSSKQDGKLTTLIGRRTFMKKGAAVAATVFGLSAGLVRTPAQASAKLGEPEKADLKFGFIKLTDMAPFAIAKELGYFEEEGLVTRDKGPA